MNNSIDWIYDLENEFNLQFNKEITNISDWNNEDNCIDIPKGLLYNASNIEMFDFSKYYFIESLNNSKKLLQSYILGEYNITLETKDILFVNNSTYAIFSICKALKELKLKRALLLTPAYFSIEHNLNELDFSIVYYHLTTKDNFSFDLEKLSDIIDEQFIQVVFFTNPIFCTGIEVKKEILEKIFEIFIKKKIWIVIDNTLDQMFWNKSNSLFNTFFLKKFIEYNRIIYIDSSTKKLFINGVKHSVIISKLSSITSIEYDSDYNIGSLTVNQVNLINEIYDKKNIGIINNSMQKNIELFTNNYLLIESLIYDTNYYMTNSKCGFHTCLMHKSYDFTNVDTKKIIKDLLFKHQTIFFPLNHFLFHETNNFGFRVNLSKHPHKIAKAIKSLININL